MVGTSVPAAYIRGGTSKSMFFHEADIPAPGPLRDRFLKRVMGSPHATQIDGMGGTRITTSKVTVIKLSERPDADIDYTFVQVGIADDTIAYNGNCGNISAAVGPFALDEQLIKPSTPGVSLFSDLKTCEVRIHNTGTGKVLIAHVPYDEKTGKSVEPGSYSISGVPGTGAPILMDYRYTLGAARERGLLPTGNVIDTITAGGRLVDCTICDAANITVFLKASDIGLTGTERPSEIMANAQAMALLKEIRGKGTQLVGMCKDWKKADEEAPMVPFIAIVSPPVNDNTDITSRLFVENRCHDAMAGTGSICLAACSRVPGSVVEQSLKASSKSENDSTFRIGHPSGVMPVSVGTHGSFHVSLTDPSFEKLAFVRTSRRIMDGKVYVPDELFLTNGYH